MIIIEEAGGKLTDEDGKRLKLVMDVKKTFNFIACKNGSKEFEQIKYLMKA